MRFRSGFVVLGCVAVLAGALPAAADQNLEKRESQLRQLMVEKLGEDAEGIRVTLVGTKAILTGRVTERGTQEIAEEVALSVPGVKKVSNQVEAVFDDSLATGQLANEAKDARVEIEVKHAVAGEIGKHAKKIEVEAADGVVSLRGRVPDRARYELALKAATTVTGVRKVVDLLTVEE